jgi:hypothetical protein
MIPSHPIKMNVNKKLSANHSNDQRNVDINQSRCDA